MRRRTIFAIAVLATLWIAANPIFAAEQTYLDLRLAQMEEELELTAEQSARVRQIMEETLAQIAVDREQLQGDPRALQDATGRALRSADSQIHELLTEEQRDKFLEFRKTGRADIRIIDLQERLGLNQPQTAEVYGILVDAEREFVKLRGEMTGGGRGGGGRGGGGFSKMRDMMEDTDKKIMKVLTEEQRVVYREMQEERRAMMPERGRGGGRPSGRGRP